MTKFSIPEDWEWRRSPNQSARRERPDCIVLHADASPHVNGTLSWICREVSGVSYHLVVGRDGKVFVAVHPDAQAWHAGVSSYQGRQFVNRFSIGVCLSNRNDGQEPYPEAQQESAAKVCATLCRFYNIPVTRITTHAEIAPQRKTDPRGLDLAAFRQRVAGHLEAK